MEAADRTRLDYEQTTQLHRALMDVRFKLLAIVPTLSGAAVALTHGPQPAVELLAIGVLGLVATLGILVYELRNTQLNDAVVRRAQELEHELGLRGGLFGDRPPPHRRLFGITLVAHSRGLSLVYGAALGGWSYLVAWGGLNALDVGMARNIGLAIGVAAGIVAVVEIERMERSSRAAHAEAGAPAQASA